MSLAVAVTCPEGVAISADSRSCIDIPQTPIQVGAQAKIELPPELFIFCDNAEKLHVFYDRYLVAFAGSAPAGTTGFWLAQYEADPAVSAARDDPQAFLRALAAVSGRHPKESLLVGYVDQAGRPRVQYTWQGEPRAYDVVDPRTGGPVEYTAYAQGIGHDLLLRPGGLLDGGGIALGNYTIVQAAELSRWLVQTVGDWMSFRTAPRLVGGPTLTAVADRSGARMIRPREITVRDFGRAADAVP